MKSRTIWMVGFICFIFVVPLTAYAEGKLDLYKVAAPISSPQINAFQAALEKDGFIVQRGQLETIPFVDWCCNKELPSFYGNNVGAPYMTYRMPLGPGQTVPNRMHWTFRLRPDEAVVLIGRTPPPVNYFSYETFLGLRYFKNEDVRRRVFGCLGDGANNLTIKTSSTKKNRPYNSETVIVTTADKGIDGRVRKAAQKVGIPRRIINTEVIPSSLVRMGLEVEADEFVILHRLGFALKGYENDVDPNNPTGYVNIPQVVFRVSPAPALNPKQLNLFPAPQLRLRGTGKTEMDLMPAVEELRKAILAKHTGLKATELETYAGWGSSVLVIDGYDGVQRGVDVLGPSRDALYLSTRPNFTLSDSADEFLIVYGVNHQASGKAAYSSFVVYAEDIYPRGPEDPYHLMLGMVYTYSGEYGDSAKGYIPYNPDARLSQVADKLYAWKVARHCGQNEPFCLEVKCDNCKLLNLDSVPLPKLFVGFRAYLEKETKTGPIHTEMVYDRVIKFKDRDQGQPLIIGSGAGL